MEPILRSSTFIVRVNEVDLGPLTGTVERARSAEKRRFEWRRGDRRGHRANPGSRRPGIVDRLRRGAAESV